MQSMGDLKQMASLGKLWASLGLAVTIKHLSQMYTNTVFPNHVLTHLRQQHRSVELSNFSSHSLE